MRLLFFCIILFSSCVFAQNPYHVNYGIAEGLPTSNIYSAFEDSSGYIWFGTDVGALKFDGYNFEHFSTDDGLSDNEVFKIFEDSKQRIWFVTLNGKLSFYSKGEFTNTLNNNILKAASNSKMIADIFEFDNEIVIAYRDGSISKLNLEITKFTSSTMSAPLFGYWILDNDISYLTIENILSQSGKNIHSIKDKRNSSIAYRNVTHNNRYYFSVKNTLFEFDKLQVKETLSLDSEAIIHLSSYNNSIFIGTRSGLYIKDNIETNNYFTNDLISFVLKDSQDNFWITTLNDGIKFIPNFQIKQYNIDEDNSIKVNALTRSAKNKLWVGTEKGLYVSNITDDNSIKIFTQSSNYYVNKIRSYKDQIFSIGNEEISIINDSEITTLNFGANDFFFDGNKYLFSSSVVFKFDPTELKNFPEIRRRNNVNSQALTKYSLFKKRTNVISKYKNNQLLFGTSLGLFACVNDSIYQLNKASEGLNTSIQDIYFNENTKDILVATNSKGISILNDTRIVHHFTKQEYLSSNTCYSIEPLSENNYLIGTNRGLDLIDVSGTHPIVRNLNNEFGLKNEKVNDIEVLDSIVLVATDKKLLSFNFNTMTSNLIKPKLVINEILINGNITTNLENLKSDENNLSISYTGILYSDYGNIEYQYRKNNEEWIPIKTRNLEISNLSYGKQNIEIRAKGENTIWSTIKAVKININKPFWLTIPFILLIALVVAWLAYLLINKRIKSIQNAFNKERKLLKEQQEKIALEKQMAELEQKALRLQMNPHFIFNALNTIKGYYSGGDISKANKYISRFSKLLRLILESDEHLISIDKEIEMLELYIKLIRLRYQDVFDYGIKVSKTLKLEDYGIPPLLLQPMVENAVIHGLAPNKNVKGKLKIEFKDDDDKLVCSVIDNGIGIIKSKTNKRETHQSKAMQITRERIEMVNESISKENFIVEDLRNPSGTKVIIILPLIKLW